MPCFSLFHLLKIEDGEKMWGKNFLTRSIYIYLDVGWEKEWILRRKKYLALALATHPQSWPNLPDLAVLPRPGHASLVTAATAAVLPVAPAAAVGSEEREARERKEGMLGLKGVKFWEFYGNIWRGFFTFLGEEEEAEREMKPSISF